MAVDVILDASVVAAVLFDDLDNAEFNNGVDDSFAVDAYAEEIDHMRLLMRHTDLTLYDGRAAEFQETAEMAQLPITEAREQIKKHLGLLGIQAERVDLIPR